jgi:tRNA pseudouridine55 synthase
MFYLIDKPAGISSFWVIRQLRKILDIRKIWHAGTLDPFATWCLIIATGKSTKLIPLLESASKEYIATIRIDGKTESFDTETPILPIDTSNFSWKSKDDIEWFLLSQREQSPPIYSAIHVNGKRSYELARKGQNPTLEKRPIIVHEVSVLAIHESEITLKMLVSSGCYMRSFWPLLWEFLGVEGWYLTALRRTRIVWNHTDIHIDECHSIDNASQIHLSKLFHTIPTYKADHITYGNLIHWRKIMTNDLSYPLEDDKIFFLENSDWTYVSLCTKKGDIIEVLKNDVL